MILTIAFGKPISGCSTRITDVGRFEIGLGDWAYIRDHTNQIEVKSYERDFANTLMDIIREDSANKFTRVQNLFSFQVLKYFQDDFSRFTLYVNDMINIGKQRGAEETKLKFKELFGIE